MYKSGCALTIQICHKAVHVISNSFVFERASLGRLTGAFGARAWAMRRNVTLADQAQAEHAQRGKICCGLGLNDMETD